MTAQPLLCSRAGGGCRGERVVAKPCFSGVGLQSSCGERWCRPLPVRAEGNPDSPGARPTNTLEGIIARKQQQMKRYIEDLGMEGLDDRLSAATQVPSSRPHRLATLVSEVMPMGTPAIMVEVSRRSPAESCNDVVRRAKTACQHGANCIAVNTDALYTPEGLKDLFAVCQAVSVPVVARDWYIHPLQLIEAKEAGAAGLLGVVAAVSGRGTPVMSSFAAALGVDAPVEVLNLQELDTMSALGVPFFAVNVSVGLSLALPELRQNIMASLLSKLPPGAAAVAGVKSVEDARRAYLSGANIVLLLWDWLREADDAALPQILDQVSYAVSGDD